jgi:hypothetical protein
LTSKVKKVEARKIIFIVITEPLTIFFFSIFSSGNLAPSMAGTSVEVIIPQKLLTHVYGESNSNLTQIRQVGLCIGLVLLILTSIQ